MRKKSRRVSSGPNQSYMISFGDTMTALLAFFIVLNSLASEQTGANLYSGTGSFIQATDSMGVPGIFPHGQSRHAVQLKQSSPLYRVEEDSEENQRGSGPDDQNDHLYVRDRELDDFERMLNEFERLHTAQSRNRLSGEVAFDRHSKLPIHDPYLDASLKKLLVELHPFLSRPGAEAELIVWTPTPAHTTWAQSTKLAAIIGDEATTYLQLDRNQADRFRTSSRQWNSSSLQRPVVSIVIRKLQNK